MADLGGVQADPGDPPAEPRPGGLEGLQRRLGRLVPQEAHDQPGADAVLPLGPVQRPPEPVHDDRQRDPARGVRLRVEEDLRVPHPLRRRPRQVRLGQLLEVLLGPQHRHQRVVQVEERLQVAERVRPPQLLGVRERQLHAVAPGERERQLGLQGAFDVQVEFGLGNCHRRLSGGFGADTKVSSYVSAAPYDPSVVEQVYRLGRRGTGYWGEFPF